MECWASLPQRKSCTVKPNASTYNPDPAYFAALVKSSGLSRIELSKALGVDRRTIDRWINGQRRYSYTDQFALECIVLQP